MIKCKLFCMMLAHNSCSVNNNYKPKTGGDFSKIVSFIRAYIYMKKPLTFDSL